MVNPNSTYKRILIVKFRFHGDMLLTTPLVATLKANYPDANIDFLLYEDTKPILSHHPDINALYGVTRKNRGVWRQIKEFISTTVTLRKNRYDLVINLADQWPIALLIKMLNSYSIAFTSHQKHHTLWQTFFTQLTPVVGEHTVEQNLSILAPLALSNLVPELSLHYSASDWLSVQSKVSDFNFTQQYIVVQPTARQFFKCWDEAKFADTIDYLQKSGYTVFLTSGPSDEDIAMVNAIASLCHHRPNTTLAGAISLLELAALIHHAALFIGVDSAPMHMAAALNTPLICLFGATNHKQWRPWSKNSTVLWAGDYQPMPTRADLDRSHRYLSCIPTQDVIAAAQEKLSLLQLKE